MGDWNGTVPTILAGDIPSGDDWKNVTDELTAISAAWTSWVPTLTNMTLGAGTVTAKYRRVGKTLDWRFKFVLGAGSAMGTDPAFSIPSGMTLSGDYTAAQDPLGDVQLRDAGTNNYHGPALYGSSTTIAMFWWNSSVLNGITSTAPFTWTSTDAIACTGRAELA